LKQTILISGIKGFLARNLTNLLRDDFSVYGIGKSAEILNDIEVYSSSNIDKIQLNPDYIILCHAAVASGTSSPSNDELIEVNVNLTKKIIEKFPTAKIIYISTASIFDSNSNIIFEETLDNPQNEYAKSKHKAEKIVLKTQNAVIFRLSSLYGIGMKENTIIPNYINQALSKKTIEVWGKGTRKQNYIFVIDACKYIECAIQNFDSIKNKVLLSVDKKEFSNNELAQIIAQATNSKINYVNDDFSKSLHYDNSLTCSLLNWQPKTNFEAEIHKYIQWKKEQF
jgi:nucleoside-diphosphate-sugar epimerase